MREKFRNADLGISGANFLIADTGSLVLCTNEGNADLSVTAPGVHIAVVGVEKVIPSLAHLSVFVKLLARSATAQAMTIYTTILTGAKRTGDRDGPREMHVVLLDHGRAALLRDETRELLRCIRCGACLNACPVYRKVGGGHAYGAVYSGPIGAVLTPEMRGLHQYPDLPQASSLCGACFDACPVHIDIPAHLVRLRKELHDKRITPRGKRWMLSLWAWVLRGPRRYRGATALLRWVAGAITHESGGERWISHAPGIARGWTRSRDLLAPVPKSFRDWWRDEGCAQGDGGKE
jgi:L-lactate dehydrogenase complex protein LldF